MSGAAGRCVGPSRPGRGRGRPWGKRGAAGAPRGRGAGRRATTSAWDTRCVSAERLRDCRRPRGRRAEADAAGAAGANGPEASGTPGAAGSAEAAGDPGAVWVDGAVGEPQVVGPVGSVWVTGTGGEEDGAPYRSPRGCERKGRPGSMGHESILELWLKVQAMRAAAGCGEGSRVELHPVPAGEGPVDRGVPGRASWVETSRGGLTGPWVKGQARAMPRASGVSTGVRPGAGCERVPGLCGRGQAAGLLPGGVPGMVPYLLGRGQAAGWPAPVDRERGWGSARGPWGRGQSLQVPGAPGPETVCGDTPGSWRGGQASRVLPDAVGAPGRVEEEASCAGALGAWQNGQAVEGMGSGGAPGTWGTGQPVGVPCAVEEEARCGGDPGFRERGQAVWVETGSGGDPGSWAAAHAAEACGPAELRVGPGGAPGLWSVEQGLGVPAALGRETGCGSIPGVWGTQQPVGAAVAGPGALGGQAGYGAAPGLWDGQRALGAPGVVAGDTGCGGVVSLWDGRQALGEQETLPPAALGAPGPAGQEAGPRDASCLCRRRQAEGLPGAAVLPRHRCGPGGFARAPAAVPAAVWVSGSTCQDGGSRGGLSLCDGVSAALLPVAPEGPWSAGETAASAAFPGPWERGQAIGGPEAPGLAGQETGSGGVPRPWGQRPSAGASAAAPVPVAPRTPRPVREESAPGGVAGLWGERDTVQAPIDARGPSRMGLPPSGGMPGPTGERLGPGGPSGSLGGGQAAEMPGAEGVPTAAGAPGPMMANASCGDVSGVWGQRPVTEGPADGPWRRRASGPVPEAAGVPLPLGVLAAVGVPAAGRVPAVVWVTGCAGEEAAEAAAGLPASRTPSAEGAGASWGEAGGRQAVGAPLAHGCGTRSWSCPRPPGEESRCENVPAASGTRGPVPPVAGQETGIGHLRGHPQQSGGAQAGGASAVRVRGSPLGEDRLRGAFS
ncbi:collagen alpha-1(I) chain-like [Panthera tigris]|uniref:collagen alpha-1(I) chain-like n=1 Tax=Panthera tigris TaxID=9694 RepID=UPI001C6FC31C|nr:collagen alpha-1(I) chain-like [Panthera tigris]